MTKDTPSDKPQKKQDVQRLGRGLSSLLGDAPAITQSTLTTNASGQAEAASASGTAAVVPEPQLPFRLQMPLQPGQKHSSLKWTA